MKKLFFLLTAFTIVLSCSSDETSTPVTPPPAPVAKYTITLSAGEGGTVSTTGGEYEAGQTVSVTATPQGEYVFTGWSDGITDATRTITISSNSTLTANFEKRKYPLTINFEGEGEVLEEIVNAGRTTEYDSGTTVKLTAQAAAEWVFVGWTGDVESTEESVQIVIGEPKEVTATFEKKKYPLTVNIEGEGEVLEEIVNAGRTTDYDSGTIVKLTAQPEDEWLFTGWSGDIGDIDPTENPIQLNIIESKTVTATFEKKKYPLTVNIEGEGEVLEEIVNAGRTTDYDSGTTVKLTAQPEDEWLFTGWSGDIGEVEPAENPIQLSIIESKTVTATFEKKKYPLTVNIEGEGEVLEEIVNAGRTTDYDSGTIVKLTAQPEDEWLFTGWSGDIGDIDPTENPIQLNIIESKTVTATFEKKKYPLTVNIEGEGEVLEEIVNAGRTTDYDSGTIVKLTAQPEDEWLFTGWSGDIGDIDPTENPIQLNIIESKTVTATFEKKKYPLTVNIEGEGEVLEEIVNAGRTTDYDSGTTVKLTAQPEDEWLFTGWSGDIGDIDPTENPIQLNIIESKTVTATFEKKKYPLTVNIEGEGEVLEEIVNAGRTTDYNSGTTVKLTALPAEGWEFIEWQGDLTGTDNSTQITIDKAKTVKAIFILSPLSLNNSIVEYEEIHPFLAEPVLNSKLQINVIVLNYIPSKDNGYTVDQNTFPFRDDSGNYDPKLKVKDFKKWILGETIRVKKGIEEGSRFRGYKTNNDPYIGIKVIKYINIYKIPKTERSLSQESFAVDSTEAYYPDYHKLFEDLKIKELVENENVKEIWFNRKSLAVPESNMSSPTSGDISNLYYGQGYQFNNDYENTDLPIYDRTYVVYSHWLHNSYDFTLHVRGHQIERQMSYFEDGNFLWGKFKGFNIGENGRERGCGTVHYPVNATSDYQYNNSSSVLSDIENWLPDNSGEQTLINSDSWKRDITISTSMPIWNDYKSETNRSIIGNDPQGGWMIYWFQSIPGENNNIPYSIDGRNCKLTNWWDLFYNWDNSINQNKTLWTNESSEESNIYIDKNGVTIKAEPWAKVGDKGIIDGVEYTIVDEGILRRMIANGQDVTKVVTSKITNFERLFSNKTEFNQSIGNWDVSNVTNMYDTFYGTNFNQDISNWDVSNVRLMQGTFAKSQFNQPIGNWDISNVNNMRYMFWDASTFNQDLSNWCVTNFTSVPLDFDTGATAWTLPKPIWGTCPE